MENKRVLPETGPIEVNMHAADFLRRQYFENRGALFYFYFGEVLQMFLDRNKINQEARSRGIDINEMREALNISEAEWKEIMIGRPVSKEIGKKISDFYGEPRLNFFVRPDVPGNIALVVDRKKLKDKIGSAFEERIYDQNDRQASVIMNKMLNGKIFIDKEIMNSKNRPLREAVEKLEALSGLSWEQFTVKVYATSRKPIGRYFTEQKRKTKNKKSKAS